MSSRRNGPSSQRGAGSAPKHQPSPPAPHRASPPAASPAPPRPLTAAPVALPAGAAPLVAAVRIGYQVSLAMLALCRQVAQLTPEARHALPLDPSWIDQLAVAGQPLLVLAESDLAELAALLPNPFDLVAIHDLAEQTTQRARPRQGTVTELLTLAQIRSSRVSEVEDPFE